MLTGYLTTLPTDTLLSAGVIMCAKGSAYGALGVTDGAPDFDPGVELGEIGFDNRAPSRLKGLTRRVGFSSVIKGTLKELGPIASGNQIAVLEPGVTESIVGGVTTETPKPAGGLFANGDYIVDFRWIFERAGGGYACIYAPLAIVRKWSMKGVDKKEAQIQFEIEAVGDPVNDLGTGPYAIEIRTSLPTGTPTTPAGFFAAYNALGVGGTGATMKYIWERGTNMTIAAGKCTRWGDVIGNTVPWTPSADVGGGAGAAVGGDGGTSPVDTGLELTATVMDAIIGQVSADSSNYINNPEPGAPLGVNAAQTMDLLFANHAKGLTVGFIGKTLTNTGTLRLENSADHTNDFTWSPDIYSQWVTLVDPLTNTSGVTVFGTGSPRTRYGWWLVDTPNSTRGASWNMQQVGRALLNKHKTQSANPLVGVTGRRLRLGINGGQPMSGSGCEYNLIFISTGRENRAQNKLVNDYAKSKWPDLWEDPRTRAALLFGDSWQEGIDNPIPGGFAATDIGFAHDVLLGHTGRNLARIADCAFYSMAYSGDTIATAQRPLMQLVNDMDFSTYTRIACVVGEYLNGGNTAQNYYLADLLRAMDPKVRTVLMDITYSSAASASNYPGYNDDLAANFATHADAIAFMERGPNSGLNVPWRSRNYGDGTQTAYPVGENPILWAALHPTVLFNQLLTPVYQGAVMRGLGDNLASKVVRIIPTNFGLDLVTGGSTGNPGTLTCYNFADTAIGGHTFTYDTVVLNGGVNAGWSSGASIATVDASGVVTPVSAGHCLLRIISDDGAVSFVDVNVTTGSGFSDNFNRADSSTTLGSPWTATQGTWGISSNTAYNVSNTASALATVDSLRTDVTVQITTSTAAIDNGVVCRLTDASNYVRFMFEAGNWYLQKIVAGVGTVISSVAGTNSNGDVLSMQVVGNNYTCKVNGTTLLTGTDAFNNTATKVGMTCSTSIARLDNFSWA